MGHRTGLAARRCIARRSRGGVPQPSTRRPQEHWMAPAPDAQATACPIAFSWSCDLRSIPSQTSAPCRAALRRSTAAYGGKSSGRWWPPTGSPPTGSPPEVILWEATLDTFAGFEPLFPARGKRKFVDTASQTLDSLCADHTSALRSGTRVENRGNSLRGEAICCSSMQKHRDEHHRQCARAAHHDRQYPATRCLVGQGAR
jgi:hypothetical protein